MSDNIDLKEIMLSHIVESKASNLAITSKLESLVVSQALTGENLKQIVQKIEYLGENFTEQKKEIDVLKNQMLIINTTIGNVWKVVCLLGVSTIAAIAKALGKI